MTEKQMIKAIPIYNDLYAINLQIRNLQLLRSSLSGKAVLDIQLHVKGALSMRVDGIPPDIALGLIISTINHKQEMYKELENKLKLV